jgi:hypothetical protein
VPCSDRNERIERIERQRIRILHRPVPGSARIERIEVRRVVARPSFLVTTGSIALITRRSRPAARHAARRTVHLADSAVAPGTG